MKKVFLSAVAAAFLLSSCGFDVCDCVTARKEMNKKMEDAGEDEEKHKAIEAEYKDIKDQCKKLRDDQTKEEQKETRKKMKECK